MNYKNFEVSCAGPNLTLIFLSVAAIDHTSAIADCEQAGYEVVSITLGA